MKEENAKILIVDDEENILKALKRLLRAEPYEIYTASTPEESIAMCSEQSFDVILSDYRMPSMNGTDMFRLIQDKLPDSIKIIISGYTDMDIILDALNQEYVDKYILKPWNEENLKIEIEKSLAHLNLIKCNHKLQQEIVHQNKKLKKVNEKLEELVAKRTRTLNIKNQALMISQSVLNKIPLPIIGVDGTMMVVLVNNAAEVRFPYIVIGEKWPVSDMISIMQSTIEENQIKVIENSEFTDGIVKIIFTPMGNLRNGVILTFISDFN